MPASQQALDALRPPTPSCLPSHPGSSTRASRLPLRPLLTLGTQGPGVRSPPVQPGLLQSPGSQRRTRPSDRTARGPSYAELTADRPAASPGLCGLLGGLLNVCPGSLRFQDQFRQPVSRFPAPAGSPGSGPPTELVSATAKATASSGGSGPAVGHSGGQPTSGEPPRRVPACAAQRRPLDNADPHHGRTRSREAGPCPREGWSGPARVRWPRWAGHPPSRGTLGLGPCDTPGDHTGLGRGTCRHDAWR